MTLARVEPRERIIDGLFVATADAVGAPDGRPALLLVHGAYDGWWVWRNWLEYFPAHGWTCHAMSLRNHPGSRAIDESEYLRTSIADYVDDVVTVARQLSEPVVLVGHSLGGFAVQKAAEHLDPAAMVLCAAVGPGQLGAHDADFPDAELAECRTDYLASRPAAMVDDTTFAEVADLFVPESPRALNDIRGRTDINVALVDGPVLAIRAEHEQYKVHRAERIADFYGGDFLLAPSTRHHLMFEGRWRNTARSVDWWLRAACGEASGVRLGTGPRSISAKLQTITEVSV